MANRLIALSSGIDAILVCVFLCRTLSYLRGLPGDTAPFCFLQNLPSLQKIDVLGFVEDEEYPFVTSHLHKSVHVK